MLIQTVLLLITCILYVVSYETFTERIPNGNNVTYTACSITLGWRPVGHIEATYKENPFGRNVFGRAFQDAGLLWTTDLCNADSDSDNMPNGVELGFPNCNLASDWRNDATSVSLTEPLGHPGICEKTVNTPADVDCDVINADIQAALCHLTTTTTAAP